MSHNINTKTIVADLEFVSSLQEFVQTYEEIYVLKMQRTRKAVVGTRSFMEGLSEIFSEVKWSYHQELAKLKRPRQMGNEKGESKKKKQSLALFITTNRRLSGEINQKVFEEFWRYLKAHEETEIMIIGKVGKDLYDQYKGKASYQFFDIAEDSHDVQLLEPILNQLWQYEQVTVFYGKFVNFVLQQSVHASITGDQPVKVLGKSQVKQIRYYLFEPSLSQVLEFFDKQISLALFQQTLQESYLAQIGSRVMALESATSRIEDRLKILSYQERKLSRRERNKQQLQALAGITHWRTR